MVEILEAQMTPLQKALKEKAVLERMVQMAVELLVKKAGFCSLCSIRTTDCDFRQKTCEKQALAHFKAKVEKGGY